MESLVDDVIARYKMQCLDAFHVKYRLMIQEGYEAAYELYVRLLADGISKEDAAYVLPNSLTPIVVSVTFGIPEAIFTEAALSFIGVGINPPTPSWGQMVGENQQYIRSYWHLSASPSVAIAVTMLSFTFLGDGIRDALDPKLKQ